jgi:hypothetical protein
MQDSVSQAAKLLYTHHSIDPVDAFHLEVGEHAA